MANYIAYYENQVGSGGVIEHFYQGSPYQRGHGIGSFLGGLFRRALPILSRGLKAVGKEALRSGVRVLDDVAGENMDFKDSLRTRLGESAMNLKRKARENIDHLMEGDGYNMIGRKRPRQLLAVTRAIRNTARKSTKQTRSKKKKQDAKKKKKKTSGRSVYDIFS